MVSERSPADPRATVVDVEVRYAETDQMGVVHHSNYIVWFELARTRLCAGSGVPYSEVEARGYLLMVTGVDVTYRKSARYGDVVAVEARVLRSASRGVRFGYQVSRGDELLATGTSEHVWLHKASGRPCRTPEFLRVAFDRLEVPA